MSERLPADPGPSNLVGSLIVAQSDETTLQTALSIEADQIHSEFTQRRTQRWISQAEQAYQRARIQLSTAQDKYGRATTERQRVVGREAVESAKVAVESALVKLERLKSDYGVVKSERVGSGFLGVVDSGREGQVAGEGGIDGICRDDGSTGGPAVGAVKLDDCPTDDEDGDVDMDANPSAHSDSSQDQDEKEEPDDGDEKSYQDRLSRWIATDGSRLASLDFLDPANGVECGDVQRQFGRSGPPIPDSIATRLLPYQTIGVRWLWKLYSDRTGGILADEMGLGKTVQVIAFLASLHVAKLLSKPVIVAVPATMLAQWAAEFRRWWPPARVCILHPSGAGIGSSRRITTSSDDEMSDPPPTRSTSRAGDELVRRVCSLGHVILTTYSGVGTYKRLIQPVKWAYAVLDEGHRIRNPDATVTVLCKQLQTDRRLILSGTPMQNNLVELWSLFDFACPLRLGTLVSFKSGFEIPIRMGGYANGSALQVETASRCAALLKDVISPHLLQRSKAEVATDLPGKIERVLFCRLTPAQSACYGSFVDSPRMEAVLEGRQQALYAIDVLRKVCNHPDLVDHRILATRPDHEYGDVSKSGKLAVIAKLLPSWTSAGHKTLLFAQQKITLDLIERFVGRDLGAHSIGYLRLDGTTPVTRRQKLVDRFNSDRSISLFLLTTRVGGLGLNLTAADRVVIFDPDWNPATDVQARERAWRLGQKRDVEIYRLLMAGTIEERIYKRQLFKRFLETKVLHDPTRQAAFNRDRLADLFRFEPERTATDEGRVDRPDRPIQPLLAADQIAREEEYVDEDGDRQGPDQSSSLLTTLFPTHGRPIRQSDADPATLAEAAQQFADKASAGLQKSANLAANIRPGTVTWTGVVGVAGRPTEPTARLDDAVSTLHLPSRKPVNQDGGVGPLRSRIVGFFKKHKTPVSTAELVKHFKPECDGVEKAREFRKQLRQLATTVDQPARPNRRPSGQAKKRVWVLRAE